MGNEHEDGQWMFPEVIFTEPEGDEGQSYGYLG
jgi:hypothetical protein